MQPFPATGAMYQISKTSTAHPVWSRDGRELISQPPGGVHWDVQVITTGTSLTASAPRPWPRGGTLVFGPTGQRNYDVVPDGRILGVIPAGKPQSAGSTTLLRLPVLLLMMVLLREKDSKNEVVLLLLLFPGFLMGNGNGNDAVEGTNSLFRCFYK